ncbi:hypothetical protein [Pectinatus frisingensis]|uniref:hypothetical protein n=1 Tax=Pectinatus frisingensis TaxID=865 RepID=UPI0018C69DE8|nr:hypothetical protein [Pectinatus frisingensis]
MDISEIITTTSKKIAGTAQKMVSIAENLFNGLKLIDSIGIMIEQEIKKMDKCLILAGYVSSKDTQALVVDLKLVYAAPIKK